MNMLSQSSKAKLICGAVVRSLSSTSKVSNSHYDALGITPKATQSDIKSAYYKLSKIYHPDKSNDEESAKKFRAITEAYEVLGNIKLKKMYDKGLIVGRENTVRMDTYRAEPEPTDPSLKFYKSRLKRHVAPTIDGKTPIYDFDAWSKSHYGKVFEKQRYAKEFIRRQEAKEIDAKRAIRQEAIVYIMVVIGGLFFVLVAHGKADYDVDMTRRNIQEQTQNNMD